jgi:hypothetical protein
MAPPEKKTIPMFAGIINDISNKANMELYTIGCGNQLRLCPLGWHVAQIRMYHFRLANFGGTPVAGCKLKEVGV